MSLPASAGVLAGVDCPSSRLCVAVGSQASPQGQITSLIEQMTRGQWQLQPSPDALALPANATFLNSVSCPSPTSCVAAGGDIDATTQTRQALETPVIDMQTPSGWTLQSINFDRTAILSSLSCLSSTSCTAVGFSNFAPNGGPMGLMLTSGIWNLTSDPASQLNAVACSLVAGCIGVGSRQVEANQTLSYVAKLEQNEWVHVDSTNTQAQETVLNGASCSSAICVAVGQYGSPVGSSPVPNQALLEIETNGARMVNVRAPRLHGGASLSSVSCFPSSPHLACMAIGTTGSAAAVSATESGGQVRGLALELEV
jgi:hypothetical protein